MLCAIWPGLPRPRWQFRRDGRVAEGAPLLREYGVYSPIEGSNPSLSAKTNTPPCGAFLFCGVMRVRTLVGSTSEHRSRRTPTRSVGGPEQSSGWQIAIRRADTIPTGKLAAAPCESFFVWRGYEGENPPGVRPASTARAGRRHPPLSTIHTLSPIPFPTILLNRAVSEALGFPPQRTTCGWLPTRQITAQAMRHKRPARQSPQQRDFRLQPALTATNGLCERRSAGRTVDARGNWANGPQAAAPVQVLSNHRHGKLRTAASCRSPPALTSALPLAMLPAGTYAINPDLASLSSVRSRSSAFQ